MTFTIIITICVLLLLAYVFDITSSKTKIPSVVLLLLLGWAVKQGAVFFKIEIPDLSPALPIFGTIGLILIVLEGSLGLEFNKSKLPLIGKSSLIALIPMLIFSIGLAYAFNYFGGINLKDALANAIPLAIISSAIAIPSAQHLSARNKEVVTYESSLSDIFGVIFFNFIIINNEFGILSFSYFIIELIIILLISFVATLALSLLLSKIKHHVKFAPIIILIVLIYEVSQIYNLPSLIFILFFGLFLSNLDELRHFKFIQKFHPIDFSKEVHKFKELTTESAFLVRSLFFLMFGFLIETSDVINDQTIIWALAITGGIFGLRALFLKLFKFPLTPLLYIAPRGLITILLFLSIPLNQTIKLVNNSLIIQVILLTSLVMMFGLMKHKQEPLIKS